MKVLKNCIHSILKKDFYFFILLVLCIFMTYWKVISADVILTYDDSALLTSLLKIQNLKHYFLSISNGSILDFQPVRDLSYTLDFKFKSIYPNYSFHFTNAFLWLFICYTVRKTFLLISPGSYLLVGVLVLLYALSPISANSVAWIAARKHILSTFFIVYATYFTIQSKDKLTFSKSLLITTFYFLSCFSQPINTLWVFWFSYFIYNKNQQKMVFFKTLIPNIIVFITSLAVSFYYYRYTYTKNISSMSKFMNYTTLDFGDPLLALGRYFYQCLNPFSALPSSHYPGSWENLLGLFLLVIFLAYCFKKIRAGHHSFIAPLIYFFFPLIIVTVNMTNIFCSDTYLLNSSIGFYWILLLVLKDLKFKKTAITLLTLFALSVSLYNFQYIKIFLDENELWLYSQQKEATPQSSIIASSILVKQKRFHESALLLEDIQLKWPNQPFLPQAIAENVFYNPNLSSDFKIKKLLEISSPMPSTYLYLSMLYGYTNNEIGLKEVIFHIFNDPAKFNMEFRGNEEKIAAIYLYTCNYFKLPECALHLEKFKMQSLYKEWDNRQITRYLKELETTPAYHINI